METYSSEFDSLWNAYPKRYVNDAKKLAWKAYRARLREGISKELLMHCVENYARIITAKHKNGTEYVMMCATFLGPNERWKAYEAQPIAGATKTAQNGSGAQAEPIQDKPVSREEGQRFVRQIMETLTQAKAFPDQRR
jgi:hypothetical protein